MLAAASVRVADAGSTADRMAPCTPETTNATDHIEKEIVEGWVIIGHEVRSFKPCNGYKVLWLMGQSPALKAIMATYRRELPDDNESRRLFMVLAEELVAPPVNGLGAYNEAAFLATNLVRVAPGENCTRGNLTIDSSTRTNQKISFDISRLDVSGLYGPQGGKRALSYEFCIPDTAEKRTEVEGIDPSITFFAESPGRIGCGKIELLCIGSTHQKNFAKILQQLSDLSYVQRIDQSFFE